MADEDVAAQGDPASLQYLNDIVVPDRAPWLPAATGWYVLGLLALALLLWLLGLVIHRWWSRRYRREAIDQLNQIRNSNPPMTVAETVSAVDRLLKRVALAAWPRDSVARLSGRSWLRFLRTTSPPRNHLAAPTANRASLSTEDWNSELLDLAYSKRKCEEMTPDQLESLFSAAARWIEHHQVKPVPSEPLISGEILESHEP